MCGGNFKFKKSKIDYLGQTVKGKSFDQLINGTIVNMYNLCLE